MSEVIQVTIEKLGKAEDEKYADGKYQVQHIDGQQVLVTKYAASSRKQKTKRRLKGHQTNDANLVYPWHRGYTGVRM